MAADSDILLKNDKPSLPSQNGNSNLLINNNYPDFEMQCQDLQSLDMELRNQDKLTYNDLPFTVIFLSILSIYSFCWIHICDFSSLLTLLSPPKFHSPNDGDTIIPIIKNNPLSISPILSLFLSCILIMFISITLITTLFKFISNYSILMKLAFIGNSLIFFSISIYSLHYHKFFNSFISIILTGFTLLILNNLKSKFKRSTILLKLIILIIKKNPILCFISLFGFFTTFLFTFTWFILLSQIYYKWNQLINYQNGSYNNPIMILISLFSIFSGAYIDEVIRNLTLTCLSSIYSQWYFNLKIINLNNSLIEIKNNLTFKFGSICLGSFLVSILEFLNQLIELIKIFLSDHDSFIHLILLICQTGLTLLEKLLRYFNNYVFSFIALFNLSFMDSSKKILEKIDIKGWSIIQNDCIIDITLKYTLLLISLTTSIICYFYLNLIDPEFNNNNEYDILYPLFGFILSAQICHILYTIIMAGNNTIILSLIFHPEIATHSIYPPYNDLLNDLQEQWPELTSFA